MKCLAFAVIAIAASLTAHAQTQDVVLRACSGTPTGTDLGGCPAAQSIWSEPLPSAMVITLPAGAGATKWARFDSLAAADRVSACARTSATPGPLTVCPGRVSGTSSWLAKSLVAIPVSVTVRDSFPIKWSAVTGYSPPDGVAVISEYQLWEGPSPAQLARWALVPGAQLQYTFEKLAPGVHYFAVSAIDRATPSIESEVSNTLTYSVPLPMKKLAAPIAAPQ